MQPRLSLACALTCIAALMTLFVGHARAAEPADKNAKPAVSHGGVIALGSGPFTGAVYKRAFALTAKKRPHVVIFPQASGSKKGGERDAVRAVPFAIVQRHKFRSAIVH